MITRLAQIHLINVHIWQMTELDANEEGDECMLKVPTNWPIKLLTAKEMGKRRGEMVDFPSSSSFLSRFQRTGSRISACLLIELLFFNLLLILSVNNPTHMYLSDLRVYFKVEVHFRVS